ncbi:MAG: hypothetical protein ACI84C_002356 [Flavobacteriales bacterium]|jgi:hypothetical protein
MPKTIAKAQVSLDEAKSRFVSQLKSFSADVLSKNTKGGGWSALEICEHVIITEASSLGYMLKKTQSGWKDLEKGTDEHKKSADKLHDALISDNKWEAPDLLPSPKGEMTLDELLDQWDGLRIKFAQFIESLDPEFYYRLVLKHPYAGRMDLLQTTDFLTHHIFHHMHQLDRVKIEFGIE